MKSRPIMSVICLFISCCLLAACGGDSGAVSAVTSFPSTPTDQKTDPMPSGSVSTNPSTPPVSVPPEPDPLTPPSESGLGRNYYEYTYQQLPDGTWPDPWEDYPTLEEFQNSSKTSPPTSIFDFYPANKEMEITMTLGTEDIVSYAENSGWQQYTGDDNINFYYGADSWGDPNVISRISYCAPQGFFVIYSRTTTSYHHIDYLYMGSARNTIGSNIFSIELASCMKSLLDKMMAAGIRESNTPQDLELYEYFVHHGDRYLISLKPDLTIFNAVPYYNDLDSEMYEQSY